MPLLPDDPTPTLLEALQNLQREIATYTTARSTWWVSRQGFHFVPDTNAQTTAADDGRRFWPVGQDYTPEMARQDSQWMFTRPSSPYRGLLESAYVDIEPEDL